MFSSEDAYPSTEYLDNLEFYDPPHESKAANDCLLIRKLEPEKSQIYDMNSRKSIQHEMDNFQKHKFDSLHRQGHINSELKQKNKISESFRQYNISSRKLQPAPNLDSPVNVDNIYAHYRNEQSQRTKIIPPNSFDQFIREKQKERQPRMNYFCQNQIPPPDPAISIKQMEQEVPYSYQQLTRPKIVYKMKIHNINRITNLVWESWNQLSQQERQQYL
jgi:hypothetical protein